MSALAAQTGKVYESMFNGAFALGGYATRRQTRIGDRPDGGKHKVDYLVERDGVKTAVSLKWQQGKGSAEDKVPWEVICLVKAIRDGSVDKAYIVIGGNGWRPARKAFYINGGLTACVAGSECVRVRGFEDFIALANTGKL